MTGLVLSLLLHPMKEAIMPDKRTVQRARKDKREGKAPSTQAGEFVREEMDHIREGKHGARSTEQAIAIGLSKARRAGVNLPPPPGGKAPTRKSRKKTSAKRSRSELAALKREGHAAASKPALARHARKAASKRSAASRSASARKAARTRAKEKA
jgi:uncharacterized protein DUF6496